MAPIGAECAINPTDPLRPQARLMRQDRPGDWSRVLDQVRADLARRFAAG
jgi:hypothetical protein